LGQLRDASRQVQAVFRVDAHQLDEAPATTHEQRERGSARRRGDARAVTTPDELGVVKL
jgi:hypothetical protein